MAFTEETKFEIEGVVTHPEVNIGSYVELQSVCDYRLAFRGNALAAILTIIFGVLAVMGGLLDLEYSAFNLILLVLGVCLILDGIALFAVPSPATYIAHSASMGLVGIWNVGITILVFLAGYLDIRTAILGVAQIAWAVNSYKRYRRLAVMPKPSAALTKTVDDLVYDVYRSSPKSRSDIIEFQITTFRERQKWKGRLCDDLAIFVKGNREDGVFAERSDVSIETQGKKTYRGLWKASFRLCDRTGNGTISQEHYNRFQEWLNPVEATLESPESQPPESADVRAPA